MKSNRIGVIFLVFLSMFLFGPQPGSAGQPMQPGNQNQIDNSSQAAKGRQSEDPEEMREQTEEGIKHLLVAQIEAWNRGDLEGFMDGYWRSPDLTFFSGATVSKGWDAALQRYQQRYQGKGKEMGRLDFQNLNIDLLGRRAAVVTGSWHLVMADGKQPHGLFTLILKRMQAGWTIVHDHTSSAE